MNAPCLPSQQDHLYRTVGLDDCQHDARATVGDVTFDADGDLANRSQAGQEGEARFRHPEMCGGFPLGGLNRHFVGGEVVLIVAATVDVPGIRTPQFPCPDVRVLLSSGDMRSMDVDGPASLPNRQGEKYLHCARAIA